MAERVVGALAELGAERAWVFYGHDGLDELTTTTTSTAYELRDGTISQFEVDPTEQSSLIRQTTVFDPAGYVGLAYWYLLYPVHHRVFSRMLHGIQNAMSSQSAPIA